MVTQANNVIEAKALGKRRTDAATVESLVRLPNPPDTHHLLTALQTTLELEELLAIFLQELQQHLPITALGFRSAEQGVVLQLGEQGRHNSSYGLRLLEETLGEVNLSRNHPFSEKELATIEHLLVPLLYPLRNGLRYRAALATAFHDPLTGANNRAAMEEALPREVDLSRRHQIPLSILIVDLDHFKQVNDRYGHAGGDCILRHAARVMEKSLRLSDELFRFGGEEFVILLPATENDGADIVAERIRQSLEALDCPYSGKTIRVTASIGTAQLEEGENQHQLFDKADQALYRAKALGRNQVMRYQA